VRLTRPGVFFLVAIFAASIAPGHARAARLKKLSSNDICARSTLLSPVLTRQVAARQYLLTPQELAVLLAEPEDTRCRQWIDAWWQPRDPIYTTRQNEARAEHERRVEVASERFARGAWPGWDDRGEVFIRYGSPASVGRTPADVIEPGIYVPSEESWYYPAFDMIARFADPTGSGLYFFHLETVQTPVGARPRSDRRNLASEWNPDYPMDYMPVDIDPMSFWSLPAPFAERGYDAYLKQIFRYRDVAQETPVAYPWDFSTARIPTLFAVQSFRGGNGVDRVDVCAEFESSVKPLAANVNSRRFVTTTVFWGPDGREIARHSRVDSVGTLDMTADSVCTVINQTSLTLPPGAYRMALTVQEDGSGRFASMQRWVDCQSMEERPSMSDLALARAIGPARDASSFNRGPLEVVPRPSGQYRLGASVPVYFEVYSLEPDADGGYTYTVEYAITPVHSRPRSLWKRLTSPAEEPVQVRSRFDAAAAGPDDVVHVSADTRNLWPGEYTLAVTITDAASRRATRTTSFYLAQ
jgi:GWxTD domain-containing protein